MKKIKGIIFDFGNVVCAFDNMDFIKNISKHTGNSPEKLYKLIYTNTDLIEKYEKGLISSNYFYQHLSRICGLKVKRKELIKAYSGIFIPIKKTFGLIKILKKKYKMGLLSNTCWWDYKYEIRNTEIFQLFDKVSLSFRVKQSKPHPDIYKDILKKLKLKPEECVYIDEIEKNIEGAKKLGLKTILFNYKKDDLRKLLDKYL